MAAGIVFRQSYPFRYGVAETMTPMIRRVVARNPSPFTFHGTGTFVIGHGRVAVIDPGPALDDHVDAILGALRGESITHLLVTHTHRDHSPACRALQQATGARTYGYGPHGGSRRGSAPSAQVEEGADWDFLPDVVVRDGDIVDGRGWTIRCVHTPGHTSNHVCYRLEQERALFTGDHVMGWSTSVIAPPDGNMADYLKSLRRLLERDDAVYWPTHGPAVEDPIPFVRAYLEHRLGRERQIVRCLARGLDTIEAIVALIYHDLPATLHAAAGRSVLAHLIDLVDRGEVLCDGVPVLDARYRLTRRGK